MTDSLLFVLLLTTLAHQSHIADYSKEGLTATANRLFPDPNPASTDNEALRTMLNRLGCVLSDYSEFNRPDDRGWVYLRQGKPLFIEKVDTARHDLHQGYNRGKPPEPDIVEERWWYSGMSEPVVFQPEGNSYIVVRKPEFLMKMATAVYQAPIQIEYPYPYTEKLSCSYVVTPYDLSDSLGKVRIDTMEVSVLLILKPQDSLYVWRLAVQGPEGDLVYRDSNLVRVPASGVGSPEPTSERGLYPVPRQQLTSSDYSLSQANVGLEAGSDFNELVYEKRIFVAKQYSYGTMTVVGKTKYYITTEVYLLDGKGSLERIEVKL